MTKNMFKINSILLVIIFLSSCGFFDSDDKMNLTIYAGKGDVENVELYLPKVNNLNFVSLKGDTPLNAAVYNGHLEIVKLLMESGASCNFQDEVGNTALVVAMERKQNAVITYLRSYEKCK